MSHYSNVQVILDAVTKHEWEGIERLVNPEGTVVQDEVYRSFVFVLVSMWGGMTNEAKQEFREKLTNKTVDEEIANIFWEEE